MSRVSRHQGAYIGHTPMLAGIGRNFSDRKFRFYGIPHVIRIENGASQRRIEKRQLSVAC